MRELGQDIVTVTVTCLSNDRARYKPRPPLSWPHCCRHRPGLVTLLLTSFPFLRWCGRPRRGCGPSDVHALRWLGRHAAPTRVHVSSPRHLSTEGSLCDSLSVGALYVRPPAACHRPGLQASPGFPEPPPLASLTDSLVQPCSNLLGDCPSQIGGC